MARKIMGNTQLLLELPYGVYLCGNGDRHLYNRGYYPIRSYNARTKEVTTPEPHTFVRDIVRQQGFWHSSRGKHPWRSPKLRDRLRGVLGLWDLGVPATPEEVGLMVFDDVKPHCRRTPFPHEVEIAPDHEGGPH